MNMKKYILFLLMGCLSCNDSFLDRKPLDQPIEKTFFKSYENCRTYAWQFYAWFPGYNKDKNELYDIYTDNGFHGANNNENKYGWDKVTKGSYTSTGSNGWKYENIRTIQYMLDNIDDSKMTETEKNHWKGVCYFFKANEYFSFLSRFGKAIWVDKVLTDADEDILYGPTISRVELAGKILEMLEFARDNVKKTEMGKIRLHRML